MKNSILYNDLSNMFVVILISLNLLYPYTFTGVWYRTFLLLGAIASFYTYQKLKQAKNDSWIFRSLSRLNYMFLLVMFLCFFIVFLNKDILYNVYIFPFYLILIRHENFICAESLQHGKKFFPPCHTLPTPLQDKATQQQLSQQ